MRARLQLEALEQRLTPTDDYWMGVTSNSWMDPTNWSQNAVPDGTNNYGADFDSELFSTPCVINAGDNARPNSIRFEADLPGGPGTTAPILTVNGDMLTPTMVLLARDAGAGPEISIGMSGSVTVSTEMDFNGGNISGTGNLYIIASIGGSAVLHVGGTSQVDEPTLGVALTLGSSLGDPAVMDFSGRAVQPLLVSGNASININMNGHLDFDGLPINGVDSVCAIDNDDAGHETIFVNSGGGVAADCDYNRVVGMGIDLMSTGMMGPALTVSGGLGFKTLRFTGADKDGWGLQMDTGVVTAWQGGKLAIDNSMNIKGGETDVVGSSTLTLGLDYQSSNGVLQWGTINLKDGGTLIAHGGFLIYGGTLYIDRAGTVTVDPGTYLFLALGTIDINTSSFDLNGDFYAAGGTLKAVYTESASGVMNVDGSIELNTDFYCSLSVSATTNGEFIVLTWTGTLTGTFAFYLPADWLYAWGAHSLQVYYAG